MFLKALSNNSLSADIRHLSKEKIYSALILLCAAFFFMSSAHANLIMDTTYSLAEIDSDPSWNKDGAGTLNPVANTITDDLELSRSFTDAASNNFLIGADLSSIKPGAGPTEAGARLFARIHTDDLLNPFIYREPQIRLIKEASDTDNYVGIFDASGVLARDINNNDAKITVDWGQTNPSFRFRMSRIGDQISLDLLSSVDHSLIQSVTVALNGTNFPAISGLPEASILGFGNGAAVNQMSTWHSGIRIAIWDGAMSVPLPATVWLMIGGLLSMLGVTRRRYQHA